MITASPKPLQCSAVSTRTSPVTQTADVAVNSASSPFVHARDSDAQGSDSSAVPTRIAAPKAPTRYHGVGRSRIMRRGRWSAKTSVCTRRRRSTTSPGRRAGRSRGVRAAPPPRPPPRPSRAAARCHAARSHARGRTAIAPSSPPRYVLRRYAQSSRARVYDGRRSQTDVPEGIRRARRTEVRCTSASAASNHFGPWQGGQGRRVYGPLAPAPPLAAPQVRLTAAPPRRPQVRRPQSSRTTRVSTSPTNRVCVRTPKSPLD